MFRGNTRAALQHLYAEEAGKVKRVYHRLADGRSTEKDESEREQLLDREESDLQGAVAVAQQV